MRLSRHGTALGAFLATPLLLLRGAAAESGEGAGAGLVFSLTARGSIGVGWEAGVSWPGPILRLTLGGSYHTEPEPGDPAYFHYAAWEPWVYVGATLGAAVTSQGNTNVVYGLWEGYAEGVNGNLFDSEEEFMWAASIAIGWRGIGSTQQFYLTPKLWYIRGFDFFT